MLGMGPCMACMTCIVSAGRVIGVIAMLGGCLHLTGQSRRQATRRAKDRAHTNGEQHKAKQERTMGKRHSAFEFRRGDGRGQGRNPCPTRGFAHSVSNMLQPVDAIGMGLESPHIEVGKQG